MARRKPKSNQNSIVKQAPSSGIEKAAVPSDEVALNDVQVAAAPAAQVSDIVQGAVDDGATAADAVTTAFAQSFTTRLGNNMPVAFGQMGNVTRTLFGGITEAFDQAADVQVQAPGAFAEFSEVQAVIEASDDDGTGQA